ncbi:MAG: NAD(P)H-dependent glycerol-3-phosphate dehydrogenase [Acholeplasmataceae bacterium]
MKVAIIGGGAWGTTLAQVLIDNGHGVLVHDQSETAIRSIARHRHPFFGNRLDPRIAVTGSLEKAIAFSEYVLLSVPTKAVRSLLQDINRILDHGIVLINVAKGIEPVTSKRVSEIAREEIDDEFLNGFAVLTGPSHAEEVIERKLTLLVSSSDDEELAIEVQRMFSNETYLRVYTSPDLIGCEVGGAVKNAIAVISGACTGLGLGENARAAVITRGIVEIVRVVEAMGGRKETAFGLTGIGDLIVTASSEHSRNFRAGKRIGLGVPLERIYSEEKQTIEGIRTIEAMHYIAADHGLELPMIEAAYEIITDNVRVEDALKKLLSRDLKSEDF